MPQNKNGALTAKTALWATAGVGILCCLYRYRGRLLHYLSRDPLKHRKIKIVETTDECHRVVLTLLEHCRSYEVLGFDCEWVTVGGSRRPVALLQLSSRKGLCALFRLHNLQHIPRSLRELLEDEKVIKVGVGPKDDAQKLAYDYGVGVASTLDLRFLAALCNHKPEGLAKLSKSLLNVQLDKNWRLACSDWEAKVLNEKQLLYAANDALVAIEIFNKLIEKLEPRSYLSSSPEAFSDIYKQLEPFFDLRFKDSYMNSLNSKNPKKGLSSTSNKKEPQIKQMQIRNMGTRSKTLYDNCLLEAPDGELLCTIDRKKAQWYLDQNLGSEVRGDPFTVRLNFEPAGRAVGEVGQYYQTPKENQCVVCGRRDAYIRKNVVPREYRKHFPVVMKSHTSHDILLLCPDCHQLSNLFDLSIRTQLASMCNAPFAHSDGAIKRFEVPELKQLKSAARALLRFGEKIPHERREELEQTILKHYTEEKEVTNDLLEEAANIDTTRDNESYTQHGLIVVQTYETHYGGLIELEKLWRQHFLDTMNPKFLPKLWNVNHNANRLEIRAQEGRVEEQDLIAAGLNSTNRQVQ